MTSLDLFANPTRGTPHKGIDPAMPICGGVRNAGAFLFGRRIDREHDREAEPTRVSLQLRFDSAKAESVLLAHSGLNFVSSTVKIRAAVVT
jgi:hypothetical protein